MISIISFLSTPTLNEKAGILDSRFKREFGSRIDADSRSYRRKYEEQKSAKDRRSKNHIFLHGRYMYSLIQLSLLLSYCWGSDEEPFKAPSIHGHVPFISPLPTFESLTPETITRKRHNIKPHLASPCKIEKTPSSLENEQKLDAKRSKKPTPGFTIIDDYQPTLEAPKHSQETSINPVRKKVEARKTSPKSSWSFLPKIWG